MKKNNIIKQSWLKNKQLLRCPFCHLSLELKDNIFCCDNDHVINLNKSGQINVLSKPVDVNYQSALFQARFNINQAGLFEPLLEMVKPYLLNAHRIVDVGCGEGSHLNYLVNNHLAIGIDISKYGIQYAAKKYPHISWVVADLANMPIASHSVDVLLNCLTPANYNEFIRVLSNQGILIKIIPNEGYLQELRARFNLKPQNLMKEETLKQVRQYFTQVECFNVAYSYEVTEALIQDLYKMTPLCWHIDANILERYQQAITLSMNFTVIIASNHKK